MPGWCCSFSARAAANTSGRTSSSQRKSRTATSGAKLRAVVDRAQVRWGDSRQTRPATRAAWCYECQVTKTCRAHGAPNLNGRHHARISQPAGRRISDTQPRAAPSIPYRPRKYSSGDSFTQGDLPHLADKDGVVACRVGVDHATVQIGQSRFQHRSSSSSSCEIEFPADKLRRDSVLDRRKTPRELPARLSAR
jgi:hypothetical protein